MRALLISLFIIVILGAAVYHSPYVQDLRAYQQAFSEISSIDKKIEHLALTQLKTINTPDKYQQYKDIHLAEVRALQEKYAQSDLVSIRKIVEVRLQMSEFLVTRKAQFLEYSAWYNQQLITPAQEIYRDVDKVRKHVKLSSVFLKRVYKDIENERKRFPAYLKTLPLEEKERIFLWQYFDRESAALLKSMDSREFVLLEDFFEVLRQFVKFFDQVGDDASFSKFDVINFKFKPDILMFNRLADQYKYTVIAIGKHRKENGR